MKVPFHIVQARREKLAQLIEEHRYLPVKELCRRLAVSEATLRRDLAALAESNRIKRTYGGALSDFNDRFPSFRDRRSKASAEKAEIAKAALTLIKSGQTCFLDSGTTISALAEAFREAPVTPLTVVTSNLPVGEILASTPDVQVFQVAGQLLHRQSTLLGEAARKSLEFWDFDVAFLSTEAMDARGLWNSQAAIVEQQRVVLRRSRKTVFCVDSTKLGGTAPHFLLPWSEVDTLLTDVPATVLASHGIHLSAAQYLHAPSALGKSPTSPAIERSAPTPPSDPDFPVHIL